MAAPNISKQVLEEVRDELNSKSPSFCLAKWLQVTIHLQNGQTHSCHHPISHKVQISDLQKSSSALHNTLNKKKNRKKMLKGARPSECDYCWKIEDAATENLSDRVIKSAQPWARPMMDHIKQLPWNASINPTYVEVSFGNECNFKCAYCSPSISSSIMNELKTHGPYSVGGVSVEELKKNGLFPIEKDEFNPYVDSFWRWWPELNKDLQVFRITGGEPLLNENTFKFLDYIKNNPMPNLTIAVNSNLGVPKAIYRKFLNEVKYISENKLVKEFQLFTSVDTFGKNAEFIRFGLNYHDFITNVHAFLDEVKDCELIFMCAYNAFSVINFKNFLEEVTVLKSKYLDNKGKTRVTLDIPYLKDPNYLSCYVLNKDFEHFMRRDLSYLQEHAFNSDGIEIFMNSEISKFERILTWFNSLEESKHRDNTRREFIIFIREYQARKKIKYQDYVPEYQPFIEFCEQFEQS